MSVDAPPSPTLLLPQPAAAAPEARGLADVNGAQGLVAALPNVSALQRVFYALIILLLLVGIIRPRALQTVLSVVSHSTGGVISSIKLRTQISGPVSSTDDSVYEASAPSSSRKLDFFRLGNDAAHARLAATAPCYTVSYSWRGGEECGTVTNCGVGADEFNADDSAEFKAWLTDQQHPSTCRREEVAAIVEYHRGGIGAVMHFVMYSFTAALAKGYTVVYGQAPFAWGDCARGSPECYNTTTNNKHSNTSSTTTHSF